MKNKKISSWPQYSQEEAEAISNVLLSNKVNYWTGDEIKSFEAEYASFVRTKYAIALANGTVALDAALKSIELREGDEVIVTSRTFIASVSAVVNAGATPIFADVDIKTQNITSTTIIDKLTNKTKAIICVHLAGWPCDMDPILEIAKSNNLWVIEDCAQAHGAIYKGNHVGSIGHIGCWSFCQDKIITTGGEGGMITTNDYALWKKIWSLKEHGKNWDSVHRNKISHGFRFLHDSFGTNWRMTELQATIGRIQLRKLPDWTTKRNLNAKAIWLSASKLPHMRVPKYVCRDCTRTCVDSKGCINACYKCYIFVEKGVKFRNKLINLINQRGISCFSGSCSEVYLEKAFEATNFQPETRLKNAKLLGETSIMFPCHPTLTEKEVKLICRTLQESYYALNG